MDILKRNALLESKVKEHKLTPLKVAQTAQKTPSVARTSFLR